MNFFIDKPRIDLGIKADYLFVMPYRERRCALAWIVEYNTIRGLWISITVIRH